NLFAEQEPRGAIDGPTGKRGEEAVEGQQRKRSRMAVAAENPERQRDYPGIDRRRPRRGTGVAAEGRAESVAVGQRVGDAADLPAEPEIGFGGAKAIGMRQRDP